MKIQDTYKLIEKSLEGLYEARQRRSIALIFMGINPLDLVLRPADEIVIPDFETNLLKLTQGMPVQYVVGRQEFLGRNFRVNSSTLIPRPETEELVCQVIANHKNNKPNLLYNNQLSILDIGTGSGAIAITLALELPFSRVMGWDISGEALSVARFNARELLAENVDFQEIDVLGAVPLAPASFAASPSLPSISSSNSTVGSYNIIVSNPPYVTPAQGMQMHVNVLNYEPHLALFIEQNDPLLFYRRIVNLALEGLLESGGWLYFEINELYPAQCMALLEESGFRQVALVYDIFEKPRIVMGQRS